MKYFFALVIVLLSLTFAFGQNEQAPIVEKELNYADWTYKDVRTGEDVNLRKFAKGSKLTIVVYFAPWCPNWRYDAPMLQRLYDQYKDKGLRMIGVGEYDRVAAMTTNLDTLKVTFPVVYESEARTDRQKTHHYEYRQATGDTRGWGSPWYIMLMPSTTEKKGDVLTKKTFVINGEMIQTEGEQFIRKHLGLPAAAAIVPAAATGKVEVCDPNDKTAGLKVAETPAK